MSSCSLYYLGGVFDRAAMISCGSDAVTDLVTGWIITFSEHGRCKKESYMIILSALRCVLLPKWILVLSKTTLALYRGGDVEIKEKRR